MALPPRVLQRRVPDAAVATASSTGRWSAAAGLPVLLDHRVRDPSPRGHGDLVGACPLAQLQNVEATLRLGAVRRRRRPTASGTRRRGAAPRRADVAPMTCGTLPRS